MTYKATVTACFTGFVVQAVVNNFVPLLFVTFHDDFGIPLPAMAVIGTGNFLVQLAVDIISPGIIDRVGYRASVIAAHITAAAGLLCLAVLPEIIDPFAAIIISVTVYAIGGGLLEVLLSPIIESCPTDDKEKAMALLHSFYSWGQVGVVLLSSLFFLSFGTGRWRVLAVLWTILPAANMILFCRVPMAPLLPDGVKGMSLREFSRNRVFWLLLLMMFSAGAGEQAVSQWISAFAETGLGISKAAGDLAGPMAFAACMGIARTYYGRRRGKGGTSPAIFVCALVSAAANLVIGLSSYPLLSLIFCSVAGFSTGIMWPGTFSAAASEMRRGGTMMFALLALAGDVGCVTGPALVGYAGRSHLGTGIAAASVFPVVMALSVSALMRAGRRKD